MDNTASRLDSDIDARLTHLIAAVPLKLPPADEEVCALYVNKIEGKYDVLRSKQDTDYAIDLLYIAYNTTPREEGEIRAQIEEVMNNLTVAQKQSDLAMRRAMTAAGGVVVSIGQVFPEWEEVRECRSVEDLSGVAEVKDFIKDEILALSRKIKATALAVKKELDGVAAVYDGIIKGTSAATKKSELALADQLKGDAAIQEEINQANAKRAGLEALVADLQAEVTKYDKLALKYEGEAHTAEERAFIMSIVQVGAQVLSAAIPAAVTALTASATGGASVIGAAAANTVKRVVGDKNPDDKGAGGTDADVVKTKVEIAEKKAAAEQSEKKIAEARKNLTDLKKELDKELQKEAKKPGEAADNPAGKAQDKETGKEAGKEPGKAAAKDHPEAEGQAQESAAVKGFKARIAAADKALEAEEATYAKLIGALSGLQASLVALDKGLGKLSEAQQSAAAELRVMQMKMLDKVEAYEKERRTQNAELVKIKALLTGQLNKQQTIQLAVQSLNLSISALKRAREIIEEISAFFLSFAQFMDAVVSETTLDIELFEGFVARDKVRQKPFDHLIASTDRFFLSRVAEWRAIGFVSEKFATCFADGYTKLAKAKAHYLYDQELKDYLKSAASRLDDIVADRERASKQKILELDGYRQNMLRGDMGTKTA
ncbi:hypothetical protein ACIPRI_16020 [Variovorax sp. LARHSF232]